MQLHGVIDKELGFFVVFLLKMLCRNLQSFIYTLTDRYAGHNNNELAPTKLQVHFEHCFYVAIGFTGTGLHLYIEINRRYFTFNQATGLRQVLLALRQLDIFQNLRVV